MAQPIIMTYSSSTNPQPKNPNWWAMVAKIISLCAFRQIEYTDFECMVPWQIHTPKSRPEAMARLDCKS